MLKQPPVRPPSEAMVGERRIKPNIAFSGLSSHCVLTGVLWAKTINQSFSSDHFHFMFLSLNSISM